MKKSPGVQSGLFIFVLFIFSQSAGAIGFWISGEVEKPPYRENGVIFMQVDGIRYTVMEQAKIQRVTVEAGAEYKTVVGINEIWKGDVVLIRVEGNRIYQIEVSDNR
ncbi:MAG: hypothetical protein F9K32_03485 [Desulfobulbaceae bacterium]|nr:MAG: hypothetical protein F9K32_03485 [Desulfobulbaceae bacterium]